MIGGLRRVLARFCGMFLVVPHDMVRADWLTEVAMGFSEDESCGDADQGDQYSRTDIHNIANIEVRFSEVDGISGATAEIIYEGDTIFSDDFDSMEEAKFKTAKWISNFAKNLLTLHERIDHRRTGVYRRRFPSPKKLSEVDPASSQNRKDYPQFDSEQEEQDYKRYLREAKVIGFSDDDIPL
jgi:hypothetical protein